MEEGWIALEGAQEAINSEKEITFDRSTLNSISPERKNREWDNRVRDARWQGRVEEEERERKNGRSSNEEVGGRGDVNGSFPWDVPVFHGVPQDLSMVVFRVVLRYTVVRGGTTYTYGVGAARCERVHVDMHTSVRWNRRGNITSNPLPSLPASSPRDSLRRN